MGIFDFFATKEDPKVLNLNHIKNLILVTMSDGVLDENELKALNGVAKKLGITQEEVSSIMKNFRNIEFVLPKDKNERVSQLWDMVMIILIDKKIEMSELHVFGHFAELLNVRSGIVTAITRNLEHLDLENELLSSFKSTFITYFSDGNAFID